MQIQNPNVGCLHSPHCAQLPSGFFKNPVPLHHSPCLPGVSLFFSLSIRGKEPEAASKQVLVWSTAALTFTAVSQLGLHFHWLSMDSTGHRWRTQVSDQTPAPSPAAKLQTGVRRILPLQILPLGKQSGEHKAGDDHSLVPKSSGHRVWLT